MRGNQGGVHGELQGRQNARPRLSCGLNCRVLLIGIHPVCQLATGDIYDGEWVEGRRTGKGSCMWVDGEVYRGQWLEDKKHGECCISEG